MVKSSLRLSENFTFQQLMQLELLIAVVLPASVILIMGVVGTWHIDHAQAGYFTLIFLAGAAIVVICERAIILRMQHALNEQINYVTVACQEFMAGNTSERVPIQGDDPLATLARTVNTLLDQQQALVVEPADDQQAAFIEGQLELLMQELRPIFDGDLRVRVVVPEGDIGVVADACNALIEKLVQFARWALYTSSQVIGTSRMALTRAIDAAQATEIQKQRLVQMSRLIATMSAAIQRMSGALDVSIGIAQELDSYLQKQKEPMDQSTRILTSLAPRAHARVEQLLEDVQWQKKMLGEALHATEETSSMAGNVIENLDSFGQQLQQSSLNMLKTVEQINSLVALAEDWRTLIETLELPPPEEEEEVSEELQSAHEDSGSAKSISLSLQKKDMQK